ncbi:MAG: NAD(P)/FAD-dependent oxidoreductase [Humidesulfovibrio sp.]|nr:NAD(P)/FAD-dependent oxidoreductase [Humidesulfovibrio sp.]
MQHQHKPRVIIVGAGFAGIFAARELAGGPCDVLIIDRNNAHTFLPLLYQVATAAVESEHIAAPVRGIIRALGRRAANLDFLMAEVKNVDFDARLFLAQGQDGDILSLPYDYLLLAPGSVTNTFGVPGADQYAFSLKNLEEAVRLRNHILRSFEAAAWTRDPSTRLNHLCFIVVGGGPTGVELAGAMAELMTGALRRDFPRLGLSRPCVTLLEAGDGLLPGFPDSLRAYAQKKLQRMGVEVRLKAQVSRVFPKGVELKDGTVFHAATTVWTAGVKGEPVAARLGLPQAPNGQVLALPTLQSRDYPEVFLAGDICRAEYQGRPLPMFGPPAIQEGRHAAANILRLIRRQDPQPFRYFDKGMMATIGKRAAVAKLGPLHLKGLPAWLLWLAVHLTYLIGFRNRLFVLANWAVDYFLSERVVRLITRQNPQE